jgi:hypothetical protein
VRGDGVLGVIALITVEFRLSTVDTNSSIVRVNSVNTYNDHTITFNNGTNFSTLAY